MELRHDRCAGLDVHKDTVVACVRLAGGAKVETHVETFETTTSGLLRLADWLTTHGCTHVAMEATGVYWKPVWHVLEDSFELILANAAAIKNMPGRKTDVNDAMWIAELLAHGLIRPSFVPPAPVQEMRGLTRTRKQFVREVAQHTQRIHKVLEDANLKIAGRLTDILGLSGRAILDAIIQGQSDPRVLAALVDPRVKAPPATLVEALTGRVRSDQRLLLKLHLQQVDSLRTAISQLEGELAKVLRPFRAAVELLTSIPGVSLVVANVIISEIGIDMSRFPSAGHLLSWAGLCPRSDESAGKRRSTRIRKGAPWLKTTLVQAAWSVARTKETYLGAQFRRLKSRRGPKKAVIAVAASMLTSAYHMLRTGALYQDLGSDFFDRRDKDKIVKGLIRRLSDLGCKVHVEDAA